jgi:hypothetical protein
MLFVKTARDRRNFFLLISGKGNQRQDDGRKRWCGDCNASQSGALKGKMRLTIHPITSAHFSPPYP